MESLLVSSRRLAPLPGRLWPIVALALAAILAGPRGAFAQTPPPVDLGIQNIPQSTPMWCWAAVAQQVIAAINGSQGAPPQCEMVAVVNKEKAELCCQHPAACLKGGSLHQIQELIAYYGGHSSAIARPTNPVVIYKVLRSGHAIIMQIKPSPIRPARHAVVIRGMKWVPTPDGLQPVLLVNDPMAFLSQSIPFVDLAEIWQRAIVVY